MGVGPPPPTTTTTVQRMTGSDDETDEEMQRALAAVKAQFKKKEMIKKEKMQHAFDSASANIQTIALQSVQKYQENIEAALEKYSTDKDQLMAERHNIFAQIKAHHDKIVNLYDAFSKEATKLCKEDQNDLCVFQDLMEACRDVKDKISASASGSEARTAISPAHPKNSIQSSSLTVAKKNSGIGKANSSSAAMTSSLSARKAASKGGADGALNQLKKLLEA